jgi:hypothetical protein
VKRFALLLPLLLLAAGCGDTWQKFTTPDFSWSRERAVSADRTPATVPNARPRIDTAPAALASPPPRAPAAPARTARAADTGGCYRGKLTGEGNTCQAMRTENGSLLTLAGPLRGFAAGDAVCVCGIPAAQQFCAQGLTLLIREISDNCANIQ